jgi:uncharacterized protein
MSPFKIAGAILLMCTSVALAAGDGMGFHAMPSDKAAEVKWVQVDLGESQPIDLVRLHTACPANYPPPIPGFGFPVRFRIEVADDPEFAHPAMIADHTAEDYPNPGNQAREFPANGVRGRYVRVTATHSWLRPARGNLPAAYCFALARMEVVAKGVDVARGKPVRALDSVEGGWGAARLTSDGPPPPPKPRLFDFEENVTDPAGWKPVPLQAVAPTHGVVLYSGGLFLPVMQNNIAYLLKSFSVAHMLVPFRDRAGLPNPPADKPQVGFWETDLRGSCAGRFLMGAGNTLRWMDDPELRRRLNELMDGVEACRGTNGYILAYPPDGWRSEEPNYARAWFTHGLIEAGIAGHPKAYRLLRGQADWFNHWDLLPRMLAVCNNAHQGHIASTRTYFSPIGKAEDLQVAERYYVQNDWLAKLTARNPDALWKYPLPTPHSYLITSFEAYMDHYRATGQEKYIAAMRGAWDIVHDHFEHVGGSMAICEGPAGSYPPDSWYLTETHHTGETCGSAFWIKFCQRFHELDPMQEKYVAEIEKSIYNVCLPSQVGSAGIRYHARMEGRLEGPHANNTCCEGQGTRLLGSLPEYIYSIAADGLYVNLFEPSTITWGQDGHKMSLQMTSEYPFAPDVTLRVSVARTTPMKLRLRVPSWAVKPMLIQLNGKSLVTGQPGTYQAIERDWADGDTITFRLPMDFRVTQYAGADRIAGHDRYSLEYGPLLMAATGTFDMKTGLCIGGDPQAPRSWLTPKSGQPLHFVINGDPQCELRPYLHVGNEQFTTYPVIGTEAGKQTRNP